jgi:hypothetical protein
MKYIMENIYYFSIFLLFLIFGSIVLVNASEIITVKANILASEDYLDIIVNNTNINFGEVSKNHTAERDKVCINNTGTLDLIIETKILNHSSGDFFNYVYLKEYGSSNDYVLPDQYNMTIDKGGKQGCIWVIINLTDYPDPIYKDYYDYSVNISIIASPI